MALEKMDRRSTRRWHFNCLALAFQAASSSAFAHTDDPTLTEAAGVAVALMQDEIIVGGHVEHNNSQHFNTIGDSAVPRGADETVSTPKIGLRSEAFGCAYSNDACVGNAPEAMRLGAEIKGHTDIIRSVTATLSIGLRDAQIEGARIVAPAFEGATLRSPDVTVNAGLAFAAANGFSF